MSEINLPTWHQCREAVKDDNATALHHFIYDYEPAGRFSGDIRFRNALSDVLREANDGSSEPPMIDFVVDNSVLEGALFLVRVAGIPVKQLRFSAERGGSVILTEEQPSSNG